MKLMSFYSKEDIKRQIPPKKTVFASSSIIQALVIIPESLVEIRTKMAEPY